MEWNDKMDKIDAQRSPTAPGVNIPLSRFYIPIDLYAGARHS